MKKLIIALTFIVATTTAFAQTKLYAYALEHGSWNSYSKKWEFNELQKVNLIISVFTNAVTINDAAQTSLTIETFEGEKNDKTYEGEPYTSNAWACFDEKNRRCTFSMIKYHTTKDLLVTVRYNNYSFRYYIRSNDVDNF